MALDPPRTGCTDHVARRASHACRWETAEGRGQRFGVAAIQIVEGDGLVAAHIARTLREAGHTPTSPPTPDPDALRELQERQGELILRLVVEGSDTLAFHVSRRLYADQTGPKSRVAAKAVTWAEIATRGTREGLLDPEEARLLRRVPLVKPQNARAGAT